MVTKAIMLYTDEDRLAILKCYGRTQKSAEEDVEAIQNWLKTQHHIPEVADKEVVLRFLCINEFSIERTKEKVDNYYSVRNFARELYSHHPLSPEMLKACQVWHFVTLPQLVGLHRVTVFGMIDENPDRFNPELFCSHVVNIAEVRMLYDCCKSDLTLFDCSNIKVAHLLKLPISLIQKLKSVIEIYVHRSYESLYEHIPKEVLPRDLGGEEKPLKELSEMQRKCFEEMKERFDVLVTIKSNEELRPSKPVNDEFLGFYGNFKNIEVD